MKTTKRTQLRKVINKKLSTKVCNAKQSGLSATELSISREIEDGILFGSFDLDDLIDAGRAIIPFDFPRQLKQMNDRFVMGVI